MSAHTVPNGPLPVDFVQLTPMMVAADLERLRAGRGEPVHAVTG